MTALRPVTPVELYVGAYRITGVTHRVDASHRLTDVLNSLNEAILLRNVTISYVDGDDVEHVDEIKVEKSSIVAAVPREAHEVIVSRRAQWAGVARPPRTQLEVVLLAPPFVVRGTAHVPRLPSLRPIELSSFARFFPITEVSLTFQGRPVYEGDVLLVNREAVSSLGRVFGDDAATGGFDGDPEVA